MAEARFNTKEHAIFDHHVVCLAGDGCMQEGVAHGGRRVRRPPEARQPDPHLRLERRHARRDGEGDAERGRGEALRGHRLRRADRRRPRHGGLRRRRSSARRRRAAASRSSSSRRRSSARASPRSPARRRRTARAARSSPTAARKSLGLPGRALLRLARGRGRSSPRTRRRSTPRTTRGRRRSRRGRRRTRSSPRSSRCRRRTRTRVPAGTQRRTPDVAGALRRHSRSSPADTQDRDAQGRPGRAPAARGEEPAPHRRQRRPLRLDAQLHRRSQGR